MPVSLQLLYFVKVSHVVLWNLSRQKADAPRQSSPFLKLLDLHHLLVLSLVLLVFEPLHYFVVHNRFAILRAHFTVKIIACLRARVDKISHFVGPQFIFIFTSSGGIHGSPCDICSDILFVSITTNDSSFSAFRHLRSGSLPSFTTMVQIQLFQTLRHVLNPGSRCLGLKDRIVFSRRLRFRRPLLFFIFKRIAIELLICLLIARRRFAVAGLSFRNQRLLFSLWLATITCTRFLLFLVHPHS
mmetsp:Transcript_153/g.390  ORF Transcript_153/g.390 Transcript_153/m.390 type:complete len:243 (-) Transcript_153:1439-2167(-)